MPASSKKSSAKTGKGSALWETAYSFRPPGGKRVIAIRFTSDREIFLGGPPNDSRTLNPLVVLKPYTPSNGLLTAGVSVLVSAGTGLVHVAPQAWVPPKCIDYITLLLGAFGVEKIKELGLWSIPSQGNVDVPKDVQVGFTNTGKLALTSYVSNTVIDLAQWAKESSAGAKVSIYLALQLDPGATGSITITDPEKPGQPIVLI